MRNRQRNRFHPSTQITSSLLVGELVTASDHRQYFLAFDVVAYNGNPVVDLDLPTRMAKLQSMVDALGRLPKTSTASPFVRAKTFQPIDADHPLRHEARARLPRIDGSAEEDVTYATDGLILMGGGKLYERGAPAPRCESGSRERS